MALLKSHSNRTAKKSGYKKIIASFSLCTLSASLPVAKNVSKDNKKKGGNKEIDNTQLGESQRTGSHSYSAFFKCPPTESTSKLQVGDLSSHVAHPGLSCPHFQTSYHHTLSFKSPRFVYPQKILRVSLFPSILYCIF